VRVFFPHLSQIPLIPSNPKTTRIPFGEGRSATVIEPLDEIMDRLNRAKRWAEG
jgi:hypothetical protein